MSFIMNHQCPECGQVSRFARAEVIDVWPSGLAGLVARGRVGLRRVKWRRVGAKVRKVLTTAFLVSAAGICATTILLVVLEG